MKRYAWIVALLAFGCAGCNMGMAPEPMNEKELKGAVEKLSPKEQIDYINSSPMTPDMKAQRIREVEQKTGYKAPESGVPKTGQ